MRDALRACDALMLECNHDPELLRIGPYHASLKIRVGGDRGHLSNGQAASLLEGYELGRLQHLVLTHLRSEEHTSELQSLMRISYAVFCLKKKNRKKINQRTT